MKKIQTNRVIALSLASAALILSACGSSSDDATSTVPTTATTITSGQLVDNYVANVDYICADGTTGVTDENGSFSCTTLPVIFSIGGLQLGKIKIIAQDRQVFPQDLLDLNRTDINNSDVLAMAQFLQSSDDDNNPRNGIRVRATVKNAFQDTNLSFTAQDLDYYATEANLTLVTQDAATRHLKQTVEFVEDVNNAKLPTTVSGSLFTPQSTLTQEAKDTLSYMGNEERLAHDVYLELYNYHVANGDGEIVELFNIATNSETTHIETVQSLINKYDLNTSSFSNIDLPELGYKDTTVANMTMGTYDIAAIQNLHDALLAKGKESKQAALEVGCMVEVTDIEDLSQDIQRVKDSNATDIETAFEFLRNGSYSHYWSFDKGLKDMGITDGCCSLGETYCHPEYPQDTKGSANSDYSNMQPSDQVAPHDGTGARKGRQ